MSRTIIALVALASFCASQPSLTPSLIEFLDLTASQITRLRQHAAEFNRFHAEKTQRYAQVSRELAEETSREVLDPLGLGQRYVEHEAICRELRTAYAQNMTSNLAVLTEAQRAKLKTLEAVVAQGNLSSAAAFENLIEPSPLAPRGIVAGGVRFFDPAPGIAQGIPRGLALAIPGYGQGGGCGVPTVQLTALLSTNAKEVAR